MFPCGGMRCYRAAATAWRVRATLIVGRAACRRLLAGLYCNTTPAGLCSTRACPTCGTSYPEPDPRNVGPWPRHEPRRRVGVGEHLARRDREVERLATGDELDQLRRGAELKDDFVAGGALELRAELAQRAGDAAARQRLELGDGVVGGRLAVIGRDADQNHTLEQELAVLNFGDVGQFG